MVQISRKIKLDPKVFQETKQSVITSEPGEARREKSRGEKKKARLTTDQYEAEIHQARLPVPVVQMKQQGSSEREILDSIALTKTKLGKKEEKGARSSARKAKRRKEKKEKTGATVGQASAAGRKRKAEKAEKVEKEFCEKCYEKKLRRKMEREREREILRAEEQQIVFDPEEPFLGRHIEEAEVMRRYIETEKVYDDTISIKSYCVCSLHAEDRQSPYKLSQQKMEQVRDAVLVVRNWKHSKQQS